MRNQSNYLHVVFREVVHALNENGITADEEVVKDWMKDKFNVKSVSALTAEERSFFIHQIQDYCQTHLNYYIPDPKEPSVLLAEGKEGVVVIQNA